MNAQAVKAAAEEKINTYKNSVINTNAESVNSFFSLHFMKELIKTKRDNPPKYFYLILIPLYLFVLVKMFESLPVFVGTLLYYAISYIIYTQILNYNFGSGITLSTILLGALTGILTPFLAIPFALNMFIFNEATGPLTILYLNILATASGFEVKDTELLKYRLKNTLTKMNQCLPRIA